MNWKNLSGYFMAVAMSAMFAAPALAQNVNPQAEQHLQNWIAQDPRLQRDPGLMNDPTYLQNHPNFATWLQQHPNAHKQVQQMGAYDRNHQWRNTDWWQKNDPNWKKDHPEWAHNDGDWDDHHQWHDKSWFEANKREWAQQHHPEWFEKWKDNHDHDYDHDHDHH